MAFSEIYNVSNAVFNEKISAGRVAMAFSLIFRYSSAVRSPKAPVLTEYVNIYL